MLSELAITYLRGNKELRRKIGAHLDVRNQTVNLHIRTNRRNGILTSYHIIGMISEATGLPVKELLVSAPNSPNVAAV